MSTHRRERPKEWIHDHGAQTLSHHRRRRGGDERGPARAAGGPGGAHCHLLRQSAPGHFRAALTNYLLGELREDSSGPCRRTSTTTAGCIASSRALPASTRTARSCPHERRSAHPLRCAPHRDRIASETPAVPRRRPARRDDDAHAAGRGADMMDQLPRRRRRPAPSSSVAVPSASSGRSDEAAGGRHARTFERRNRARPLDDVASDLLLARLKQAGVEVGLARKSVGCTHSGRTARRRRSPSPATPFPCEVVGVSPIGVQSDTISREQRVTLGATRGVVVDGGSARRCPASTRRATSAEHAGRTLQLWEPAREQARVAGRDMAGGNDAYRPGPTISRRGSTISKSWRAWEHHPRAERRAARRFPGAPGAFRTEGIVVENGV